MRPFLDITSALSDENRVRALLALRRGELCACQITELLALAPSTVSKHLFLLKQAGLIDSRKRGRWIHYRIAEDSQVSPEVRAALQWVATSLARNPRIVQDTQRLRAILKEDPEALCRRQCRRRNC
jgi:DNA-binding transcriptional ArsR family regulator